MDTTIKVIMVFRTKNSRLLSSMPPFSFLQVITINFTELGVPYLVSLQVCTLITDTPHMSKSSLVIHFYTFNPNIITLISISFASVVLFHVQMVDSLFIKNILQFLYPVTYHLMYSLISYLSIVEIGSETLM